MKYIYWTNNLFDNVQYQYLFRNVTEIYIFIIESSEILVLFQNQVQRVP